MSDLHKWQVEWVVDVSAVLAVVLGEPERDRVIESTAGDALIAPGAFPFEIANALVAMGKRGRLDESSIRAAWHRAQEIPIRLVPVDIESSIDLALRFGMYAYDAYYLSCALSHQSPLLTLDRRMQDIADRLAIRQMEPS